jgi:probable F420-dependent oxidoreductase
MPKPFRFAVQVSELPAESWAQSVRRIESLGYSTLYVPDHFGTQWDPTVLLTAAAAVTQRLNVGSLVYDVDYRHPVVFAKAAATLHLISGGRHEFGLGAGWMRTDYDQAGMDYAPARVRIERLDEALEIISAMWTQESTTYTGRHYRVREIAKAAPLPEGERPRIVVGGGGQRVLTLAGRRADIVGINPSLPEGRITSRSAADLAPERLREKLSWVRAGAESVGRSLDDLELSSLSFMVALTDDPGPIRTLLSGNTGMSVEQIADCPLFLTGSAAEVRDRLEKRREQTGISYIVITRADDRLLETFAEQVVAPLAGR